MKLVIDASATTKLFLDEPDSHLVAELWDEAELHAPTIVLPETAAAVALGAARRRDPRMQVGDVIAELRRSAALRSVDTEFASRAAVLTLGGRVRGMDAIYLATALEMAESGLDVALLSFDGRQREAALDLGLAVIPAVVPDR
jgi:predicted nucleic acid-binding protein